MQFCIIHSILQNFYSHFLNLLSLIKTRFEVSKEIFLPYVNPYRAENKRGNGKEGHQQGGTWQEVEHVVHQRAQDIPP